jgi:ribosomal protein S18 acetylase RimI-like enzyme
VEQHPFLTAGFEPRERLHLLAHDLTPPPEPIRAPIRRARRGDRQAVLDVDGRAFPQFWQLDEQGLVEALAATPASRFRVAADPGVVGYAICGRAGRRGYLQRLAVHPQHQASGLGRALVVDALRWMRRRGADRAVVNTQESNTRALELYERMGFRRLAAGLAVLETTLDGGP